MLNGTFLCFKMCAHLGTYFKVTTILYFLYTTSILLFYVIFTILCDDNVVLFVLCKYVTYRGPQGRNAY